jgi:uncharacterized damage-inducible protein DinB
MTSAGLLTDAFGRIRETVAEVAGGLSPAQLAERLDPDANSIAWLLWHLTRVQDDHVAAAFGAEQVWVGGAWAARLGLPPATLEHGYGHTRAQVATVTAAICGTPDPAKLLAQYHDAVHAQTTALVSRITEADLDRVVDQRWTPPVTLAVRLVSVIDDDARHVGQAEFIRGVLTRR